MEALFANRLQRLVTAVPYTIVEFMEVLDTIFLDKMTGTQRHISRRAGSRPEGILVNRRSWASVRVPSLRDIVPVPVTPPFRTVATCSTSSDQKTENTVITDIVVFSVRRIALKKIFPSHQDGTGIAVIHRTAGIAGRIARKHAVCHLQRLCIADSAAIRKSLIATEFSPGYGHFSGIIDSAALPARIPAVKHMLTVSVRCCRWTLPLHSWRYCPQTHHRSSYRSPRHKSGKHRPEAARLPV